MTCARNCGRPAGPGRTRCPECAARDRATYKRVAAKRSGGARTCPPGCTCLRHGSLARGVRPAVEREGNVVRIYCPRCRARISGNLDDAQVAEVVSSHFHQRRVEREKISQVALLDGLDGGPTMAMLTK